MFRATEIVKEAEAAVKEQKDMLAKQNSEINTRAVLFHYPPFPFFHLLIYSPSVSDCPLTDINTKVVLLSYYYKSFFVHHSQRFIPGSRFTLLSSLFLIYMF